jgi:hypothetical protein
VRRRDFAAGLLLAGSAQWVGAEERAEQHRIAIVITSGPIARINDPQSRAWQAFWEELRRLGDVEGQNLTVERYSGEGRPEGYAELAREIVSRKPDVIVPISPPIQPSHHEGRECSYQHDTDRRLGGLCRTGSRAEPGATWRQHYRNHC